MQYEYFIKKDINGHEMIKFISVNTTFQIFLDDFLFAINELDPRLKNRENYWNFNIENEDTGDDDKIKNRFGEYVGIDLIIETLYGKIVLSDNLALQSEDNLELINNINKLLENNYLFLNKK